MSLPFIFYTLKCIRSDDGGYGGYAFIVIYRYCGCYYCWHFEWFYSYPRKMQGEKMWNTDYQATINYNAKYSYWREMEKNDESKKKKVETDTKRMLFVFSFLPLWFVKHFHFFFLNCNFFNPLAHTCFKKFPLTHQCAFFPLFCFTSMDISTQNNNIGTRSLHAHTHTYTECYFRESHVRAKRYQERKKIKKDKIK